MDTHERLTRLACQLYEHEIDGLLVTDLINIRYLTGFHGSSGALLVCPDPAQSLLVTDGRYHLQATNQAPEVNLHIDNRPACYLVNYASKHNIARLGFESHVTTVEEFQRWQEMITETTMSLVARSGLVERLREIKDPHEIELIRQACHIGDAALTQLIHTGGIRPGQTELQVSRALEMFMFDYGAEALSFETIVAAGPHSAIPHHQPTMSPLVAGDFVKIDFGAMVQGYHADMTRTFIVGKPADWQRDIYQVVLSAQQEACQHIIAETPLADIDSVARSRIDDAGYSDFFTHGLGHGVGLYIHEAPALTARATGKLLAHSVVTVEPGIYLAGRGGVRIEDTLAVGTHVGDSPDILTQFPKELTILEEK